MGTLRSVDYYFLDNYRWFIAHRFARSRDDANKRKELRLQYLIEAYRRLERSANRKDNSRAPEVESAIADIYPFGSPRQIELARQFSREFADSGAASLDELLINLRQELRDGLNLPKVHIDGVPTLRIEPKRKIVRQPRIK